MGSTGTWLAAWFRLYPNAARAASAAMRSAALRFREVHLYPRRLLQGNEAGVGPSGAGRSRGLETGQTLGARACAAWPWFCAAVGAGDRRRYVSSPRPLVVTG